ncbi:GH92 family glycosyl hydrolase [Zunongwangia sp. F363]|uniref:GH92 family glycosyl hydrolase n=1 Tax=Autumnicola tepida TaxID=3075595 RepID=A0ABU3C8W5_9FLAO|nr:GH92 family glycosyl hydrolase [Zunongwangia sp. F363]MDT0642772.1 GH92 family glycosyl hydrolase [Zunongwangia sp. F363]
MMCEQHKIRSFKKIILLISILSIGSCKRQIKSDIEATEVKKFKYVDKVYPLLDTKNSRWFYFSSASRPFGMVNLSPDTQINGAWDSGYRFDIDTIKGFSHIHAWQLSGVSVMPVTFSEGSEQAIYTDYYSKFSHKREEVSPGFHRIILERYQIEAAFSSTKRVGFHKYSFPNGGEKGILFNLNTILGPCENSEGKLIKIDDKSISGSVVALPTHRRPKPFKIYFYATLNKSIDDIRHDRNTGNYLLKLNTNTKELFMKVALSYTSVENAKQNLEAELPHWDFKKLIEESKEEWNDLLGRIEVTGGSSKTIQRFYTDLWHSLQGRRVISDHNGAYPDYTGASFKIKQLPLDKNGKPKFNHYNSDSFWGAQWTINTLWGLVYPEIMQEFSSSLLQYYKDGGLVPRGPSGGNYTYVMTGASSTPFIVSAIQKGILRDHLDSIYLALKKNHMPGGIMEKAGYEHDTNEGGGLSYYLENGYVPYPLPDGEFGSHQDGASLTLEYAYQDWTLSQLASKLGYKKDEVYFKERAQNYKNVFNPASGWMQPKDVFGNWSANYDSYQYRHGFIEANGAQATWFVPQDLEGLANLIGGKEKAVQKLAAQFKIAKKSGFTSGNSHAAELHPEYRRIPINYGNQPSIQTAYIFNQLGRPDLTQFWSRKVIDEVFTGLNENTGYNGDEDQGLMGSLAVLMKIGIFQMNGGTDEDPAYQIGSPIFDSITIKLHPDYYPGKTFTILAEDNLNSNLYVQKMKLNGEVFNKNSINHSDVIAGGKLRLQMASKPTSDYKN